MTSSPADLLRHADQAERNGKTGFAQTLRRAACKSRLVANMLGEYPPRTVTKRLADTAVWTGYIEARLKESREFEGK